ncbi:MAG: GIY-YIG nuclease family protein [Desulfobacter sp.]|nr:GIY-YIG nuclease family protein [Desulfobacter sp.]WDP86058.1 MAG: GIY-YIG nuclease family protein [Desulfobacter sp.]
MNKEKKDWQVYLLECSDKSLYCGVTKDLDARIKTHNLGRASKYTRGRLPVTCVAQSPFMTKRQAFCLEYQTKRMPASKKIAHLIEEQKGRKNSGL